MNDGMRDAVLVVNTQSRRGQSLYSRARDELAAKGVVLAQTYPVRDASRMGDVIDEAIDNGFRFIIVGGGDGTISSVVSSFAYQNIVLGILPMGTANNFARANSIPLDLKGAVDTIASGRVNKVDLGRVGGDYFTNAVSIGLSSSIHRGSPDPIKRYLGRAGYLAIATQRVLAHQPFQCSLSVDGEAIEETVLDIRIANGPYHGGLKALPVASVTSGELVARLICGTSKWSLGKVWSRIATGREADPGIVRIVRGCEIEIRTSPEQHVSVDGEVITRTPVQISVAPAALQLMVP